jgi:cytosine/adenosine deaminase-related metal-dependent hydrolase
MSDALLIRNGRPMGGKPSDILIRNGLITEIAETISAPGATIEDVAGDLVLPGLVEAHAHLDKSLWGMGWRPNDAGPRLIDKIDNERHLKRAINIDPERQSARQVVLSVGQGTTHIRSHVDVDTDLGLWGIEGVLATRKAYADIVDIELVAFPQSGLLRRPGTLELMDQAMKAGAHVVGGIDPCAIDRDPKGHLDAVFGLAQKYGRPIDIHLHEPGEMGAFSFDLIFERTRALGMQGKVVVSHAFCLGAPDRDLVDPMIEQLAELDIGIMTTGPAARPAPPVKRLLEAGIRDTWGPYGNADMLERVMFIGLRNGLRRDDEVELAFGVCTTGGASVMRLENYGLKVGAKADLMVVAGETITHAAVARPVRRLVVKHGRVVARNGNCIRTSP